ncbi:hypothetical protein QZM18_05770 [Burkholderia diffusa]|uniref:hypothetical protein n=1 Tax=Burkholderia diffusa TaxID=488732 RepID=UPI002652A9AA|nr:hypothetical protein [Burkholderia diffusa]MDN7903637.1 hypothetical protein [Burkholderia diffusa]
MEIDKVEDPTADKKTEKARRAFALTVRQLCDDYKEKAMVSLAEGSIYIRDWDIENMVNPNLGSLEARKVTCDQPLIEKNDIAPLGNTEMDCAATRLRSWFLSGENNAKKNRVCGRRFVQWWLRSTCGWTTDDIHGSSSRPDRRSSILHRL